MKISELPDAILKERLVLSIHNAAKHKNLGLMLSKDDAKELYEIISECERRGFSSKISEQ